jgi:hypothetical protein
MIFNASKKLGTKNPKLLCSMLTAKTYQSLKQNNTLDGLIVKKE